MKFELKDICLFRLRNNRSTRKGFEKGCGF